ncbi:hypothetical protein ACFSTE_13120 [Aquimarina hainanensis]|uniref:Uncharacterized protein n=1 Tax=Aquimarina hainanensis TaxID=1578017 RepID=A0ABW5NC80_9FLAO
MKSSTVKEIKSALSEYSNSELIAICLRLSRFKKENKELLTYLLFEAADEEEFITQIKEEMDEAFEMINTQSMYYIKKSIQRILRTNKKYIRYSSVVETEIEILLHFCQKLQAFPIDILGHKVINGMYVRELKNARKKIATLHEDLQYDYNQFIEATFRQ